jgi:hypothetical protein
MRTVATTLPRSDTVMARNRESPGNDTMLEIGKAIEDATVPDMTA